MESKYISAAYLRNFIFGVEDSLVSTVGLLSGIAMAGMSAKFIFVTGIVLIFVEAFSMAAGSFLSEHSAAEYMRQTDVSVKHPLLNGVVMFFSYFISGFIPLFPYLVFPVSWAFWISVALSLLSLFILGIVGAKISNVRVVSGGLRMFIIGGAAIALGVMVGGLAQKI